MKEKVTKKKYKIPFIKLDAVLLESAIAAGSAQVILQQNSEDQIQQEWIHTEFIFDTEW